jgi:hypothetical protein
MAFSDLDLASPTDGGNEGDLISLMQGCFWGNEFKVHGNHGIVRITTEGRVLPAIALKELPCRRAVGKLEFDLRGAHDILDGGEKFRPDLHANALLQRK